MKSTSTFPGQNAGASAVRDDTNGPIPAPDEREDEFRLRARRWLSDNLRSLRHPNSPATPSTAQGEPLPGETEQEFVRRSRRILSALYRAGYMGIVVPREFGGQGLTARHQAIFDEEAIGYEAPGTFGGTFGPIFPTLVAHCSAEQKREHFPRILSGAEFWVQLMSEPGAGSDLAGVTTTATQDGGVWTITGQKVWTTAAHLSEFGMCLARTDWDAPKHRGLTMFMVNLRSAGVTVRPLRQMTGEAEFNEVFLDGVEVPPSGILGDVNHGWRVVQTWLTYEHGGVSSGDAARADPAAATTSPLRRSLPRELVQAARESGAWASGPLRDRIISVFVRDVVQLLNADRLAEGMRHGRLPEQAGSMLKLLGALGDQRRAETAVQVLGARGAAWLDPKTEAVARRFLASRALSIAAGTNEIHRNIIAEHVLGLPREPSIDRAMPFRQALKNPLAAGSPPAIESD
jgi:alkylation response protein AidB-like acyl-CoA dehydrogenase